MDQYISLEEERPMIQLGKNNWVRLKFNLEYPRNLLG